MTNNSNLRNGSQEEQKNEKNSKVVGRGSFSEVKFFARNSVTKKEYVMKCAKNDEGKKMLRMEKNLLKTISHQNIIKSIPCELKKYDDCLIMERMYCDLLVYINRKGNTNSFIPENILKTIFSGIFSGLNYLHTHNIAHRDIKPENILLGCNKGEVVICDLGTALQFASNTVDTSICGTPIYQSPEVLDFQHTKKSKRTGKNIPKSDIFSAGVSLFVCHTATLPRCERKNHEKNAQKIRIFNMLNLCRVQDESLKQRILSKYICKEKEEEEEKKDITSRGNDHLHMSEEGDQCSKYTHSTNSDGICNSNGDNECFSSLHSVDSRENDSNVSSQGYLSDALSESKPSPLTHFDEKKEKKSAAAPFKYHGNSYDKQSFGPALSVDGFILLEALLQLDPESRPTAQEALEFNWFKN